MIRTFARGFSAKLGGFEEPESSKDLPLVEGNVFP